MRGYLEFSHCSCRAAMRDSASPNTCKKAASVLISLIVSCPAMAQANALAPIERLHPSIFTTSRCFIVCKNAEIGCGSGENVVCFRGNM